MSKNFELMQQAGNEHSLRPTPTQEPAPSVNFGNGHGNGNGKRYREALENHSVRYIPQQHTIGASSSGMVDFTLALMPPSRLGGQNLNREAYLLTKPGARRSQFVPLR